jgi:hypothetical protein
MRNFVQQKSSEPSRLLLVSAEIEFLDIILTKDPDLLLHAIHSPSTWRVLQKAILYSGFKNPYKKYAKQETLS